MKEFIINILNGFEIEVDKLIELFKLDLEFNESCVKYLIRWLIRNDLNNVFKIFSEEEGMKLESLIDTIKTNFLLHGKEVTCSISKSKNGKYLINLNRGLIQFMFDYTRLFCFNYSINFKGPTYFERKELESNNFKFILKEIITKYWKRSYEKSEIYPHESLKDENSKMLFLNLYFEIQFFVAHELSHKLIKKLDINFLESNFTTICDNFMEKYNYSSKFKEDTLKKWYEEFECDDYAIQIIFNPKNIPNDKRKIAIFSLFNYFLSLHICEMFYINEYPHIDDLRTGESHPPFKLRLNHFLQKIMHYVNNNFIQNLKIIKYDLEEFINLL